MKTDKDVLQALIDGYTLTNSAKEIIYLDQSGDYIGVDLSKISPEDWSILKPTITINGYEITPEVKHPKEGQKYYFPLQSGDTFNYICKIVNANNINLSLGTSTGKDQQFIIKMYIYDDINDSILNNTVPNLYINNVPSSTNNLFVYNNKVTFKKK